MSDSLVQTPEFPAISALKTRLSRINAIEGVSGLLQWDQETLMPEGGAVLRATQRAALDGLAHEMLTASETADLLDRAQAELDGAGNDNAEGNGAMAWMRANVNEARRQRVHASAVPRDLVEALTKAAGSCETAWRAARAGLDFAQVRGPFEALLALVRQEAQAKAEVLEVTPYEALLDAFEPGARIDPIMGIFNDLETFLPPFIDAVIDRQALAGPILRPRGPFPARTQESLARQIMAAMGFDFHHGRLDTSLHPFCSGPGQDVRITTRYDETDFTMALFGVIHETGHALYEQGLPLAWADQPVGKARSMSVHESQSLLWEMQVGHSPEFLRFVLPSWRKAFGGTGEAWSETAFGRMLNKVERSFIRTQADEVTYPVHVIVRTKLERAMVEGQLAVADLPGAWNDSMERLLGVRPPNDALGCLQDIHWYDGLWGYFPAYSLGAMTAAQLFAAAKRDDPTLSDAIGRGDLAPLRTWLRTNVHAQASLLPGDALLTRATGRPLDPEVFKAHLKRRYLDDAP